MVFGQGVQALSSEQVADFYQKSQASGLTEMEIEQAAMAKGYTLADIAKMRQKLAEQKSVVSRKATNVVDTATTRKQEGSISQRSAATGSGDVKVQASTIFGTELFNTPSQTFEPNLKIATPNNYILGPDDELLVEIYGVAADTYKLKVSPDGTVKPSNMAPIMVNGLSMEQAKAKIIDRLQAKYGSLAGRGAYVSVTLGAIRSIKVTVTGQARKPGVYTISSLATTFNALYLCGGPNDLGSYRSIKVIRGGKTVRTIDLYDFLLNDDQKDNILLHDQDIISIPFYTTRVVLSGEVKRAATYELNSTETLQNVIDFAGGYSDKAYKANLTLHRNTDKAQRIITLNKEEIATFKPQTGDRYAVGRILDRFENHVRISGAVFRGGEYALGDNLKTFKQLLGKADGLREDAFKKRAIVHREKDNLEPELLSIDIEKILSGDAPDFDLRNQDHVVIKSIKELREQYFVSIMGEVVQASDAPYEENMTVSDLVSMANGFKDGAISSRIEIARRIRNDNNANTDATVQIIPLKIDNQLALTPNDAQFKLQPYDIVFVRKAPQYDVQRKVEVAGKVFYPGTYVITENTERISNIIERVGGVKPEGFLAEGTFSRNGKVIAVNLEKAVSDPTSEDNLLIKDGDALFIPDRSEIVTIGGGVLNPSAISFKKSYTFKDYLSQAGGYSEEAIKRKVYVTNANGYTERTKGFWLFKKYPVIKAGSTVFVPFKKKDQEKKSDISSATILSLLSTMVISTITILATRIK